MRTKVIQFEEKDAIRFLGLARKEGWSGRYLGDNKFMLTEEQIERVSLESIPFVEVSPNGTPLAPKKPLAS